MVAQLSSFVSLLCLAGAAVVDAAPLERARRFSAENALARRAPSEIAVRADSLNGWGGISSMQNFDNFNGKDNFSGGSNSQTVVIQEKQTVCKTQKIEIIQQKLVVLQEMAKKIVTEQICEVETQTIVIQQFSSGIGNFGNDVQRKSGKQVGYDKDIAGKVGQLTNSDGSLSTGDLGFNGQSVGNQTVVPQGNNWDDQTGPDRVAQAAQAAQNAQNGQSKGNSTQSSQAQASKPSGK